jgi:hypothetical protein
MTPKSYNKVDGGRATARVRHVKKGTHTVRDGKAYWNILAFAKEQPADAEWEADQLAADRARAPWAADILAGLGLDGHTDCPPVDARVTSYEGVKSPGPRPATATKFPEPAATPKREPIVGEHIEGSTYHQGCRCTPCRDAYNAYHRAYMKRRRADAKAAGGAS